MWKVVKVGAHLRGRVYPVHFELLFAHVGSGRLLAVEFGELFVGLVGAKGMEQES